LNVIDEYSRECLAIDTERSIDADGVVACLERLAAERCAQAYVRFHHDPGLIAYAVADWCRFNGTDTVFIDPGSPWQNGWIESFNGRLRDKYLNGHRFDSLLEAKVVLEDWRIDYNINRSHSAHCLLTPVKFVEAWLSLSRVTAASHAPVTQFGSMVEAESHRLVHGLPQWCREADAGRGEVAYIDPVRAGRV
jgi:putative transposase